MKDSELFIQKASEVKQIFAVTEAGLDHFERILPRSKDANILIKPNLNSNMNALTGNTTDLRLLAGIISTLKERGYKNIIIGEGTNSGFFRENINVISRLKVDRLAQYFGVNVIDFNFSDSIKIELEDGVVADVAKPCLESDFFINVPKLKMHYEVGMTVCLKSLIGCLVGRENKKKVHSDLPGNILKLNEAIKPDLYIVDGLIAMEGTGPSLGTPIKTDLIMVGTDPFLLDMIASKVVGFEDLIEIPVLKLALEQGLISPEMINKYKQFNDKEFLYHFRKPEYNFLVALVINPHIQKHLIRIRYAPFIKRLFDLELVKIILFKTGISQDRIIYSDGDFSVPYLNKEMCRKDCSICKDICPLGFYLPDDFDTNKMQNCIKCLYCYCACPANAIKVDGNLGFFSQQIRQYDEHIRNLFKGQLIYENIDA